MNTSRRLNSPLVTMMVTLPATIGFVVWRWTDAAQHQLTKFVVAGSSYAQPGKVPKGLFVGSGNGYDGEFYYRLALDPFDLNRTAFGIRLDSFSRVERMGYPFLAWLVALGQHSHVPLALVIVNVVAAAVLGVAGGLLAQSAGRHALWGLVFPLYWGYLWTLGRDLTELTAAALLILGVAALLRNQFLLAGLIFLGAVVSKETTVLFIGVLALASLWVRIRQPETVRLSLSADTGRSFSPLQLRRNDVAWILPLVGFALWQLVLLWATGHLPIYKSGGENLGAPFLGFVRGFSHYLHLLPHLLALLWFGELGLLIIMSLIAAKFGTKAPFELRVMWLASIVLGVCTATGIWLGDVGFRSLDDIYLFGWVVLLFHPSRLSPPVVLCGGAYIAVFIELVRYV